MGAQTEDFVLGAPTEDLVLEIPTEGFVLGADAHMPLRMGVEKYTGMSVPLRT